MPGPMDRALRGYMSEEMKKNRPKLTKKLVVRILKYLLPYWPQLLILIATIALAAVLDLLPSLFSGRIIDDGFLRGDFRILALLVVASFTALLASGLINILKTYLNTRVAMSIIKDMRNQMYAHLQKMSQRFYSTSKQGDILTRMTSDIDGIRTVITNTVTESLSNVALLAASIVALYQKNWILATVGITIVPLFIIPTRIVGKKRWSLTLQTQEKHDKLNQILSETLSISGQQLVKLFTNEEREYQEYAEANAAMCQLTVRSSLVGRWYRMAVSTFTNMGPLLIYLIGGFLILKRGVTNLTVGDITVMVTLLTRMYRPVQSLLDVQVELVQATALFQRIFDYFDMPVEIENRPDAVTPDHRAEGSIAFRHVDFHYNEDSPILRDVDFEVPAGATYAIVGPSGAGKSTIINLLVRLYDVCGGSVELDGRDIRELDLRYLRQNVGMVTQDNYLFNGTIRENLLYARHDATEAELIDACKKANIHDYIITLPEGYDTVVGNRGMKLSGGEKQRLSIARIILRDPAVLILDEATSSLDSISESLIQEAIGPLLENRTSLVIAHRLSTIMAADRILVVEDGRIVEQGTHAGLLKENGIYTQLYETQFRQVLDDASAGLIG